VCACHVTQTILVHNNKTKKAILALIAFAASAYIQTKGHHEPRINYFVFVGVTGWLLSMLYAAVSCAEGLQRMFWCALTRVFGGGGGGVVGCDVLRCRVC
jgi:hypothetical protein